MKTVEILKSLGHYKKGAIVPMEDRRAGQYLAAGLAKIYTPEPVEEPAAEEAPESIEEPEPVEEAKKPKRRRGKAE
jgi:hypothetical protein